MHSFVWQLVVNNNVFIQAFYLSATKWSLPCMCRIQTGDPGITLDQPAEAVAHVGGIGEKAWIIYLHTHIK